MVFDVARAVDVLGIGRIALELREDRGKGLADEIGEHVEAAAMRHADHEFADTEVAAAAAGSSSSAGIKDSAPSMPNRLVPV